MSIIETKNKISDLNKLYKAWYFTTSESATFEAPSDHSYYFKAYIGVHHIEVAKGDCIYYISDDEKFAHLKRGPVTVDSLHCATIIRGFMPPEQSASLEGLPLLPYVNGCSTRQIFSPPRPGDPTLQFLNIPANSAEQAHHVHSTVRVAYVLSGSGKSVVGIDGSTYSEELYPGKVCILEPMCPHHFETPNGESIQVVPLHVFSSVGSIESLHPMFNGTHMLNHH